MASLSLKLRPNCNCAIGNILCTASYSNPGILLLDPPPPGGAGVGAGFTILACTGGCLVAYLNLPRIAMLYGLKYYFVSALVSVAICGHLTESALIKTCLYPSGSIRRMSIKTSHCYIIFTATSQLNIGATIWRWRREAVSVYVVNTTINNAVPQCLITSTASEPVEKENVHYVTEPVQVFC